MIATQAQTRTPTQAQVLRNPEQFAKVFLRILDKEKNLVPFRWNKAQVDLHYSRTGRDIILKARQLGFSTYVQGEMFRRTITKTRTTLTLAHDSETTQKLRRMADRFYTHCRYGEVQPIRKYANATLATYNEFDSTAIVATAGNLEVGRGDTYTDVHGSEVAFWQDAEHIIAGAAQGGNPDIILESTPNGAQGYFYEKCMEAIRGEGVWKLHFYPWWWDVTYRIPVDASQPPVTFNDEEALLVEKHALTPDQILWRRNKKLELGKLFTQEYPEDPISCFLTSGNSYFGDISHCWTAPLNPTYQEGHKYIGGLDFGQTNDFTALIIIDHTTHQMVDILHVRKLEWAEMRRRISAMCHKWHVKTLVAEVNSIGSVNIELLRADNLHIKPFNTTNTSKAEIMSDLHEALHSNLRLQDNAILRHEMNTFVSTQMSSMRWQLAAEGDGHDDTVIALALANQDIPIQLFI